MGPLTYRTSSTVQRQRGCLGSGPGLGWRRRGLVGMKKVVLGCCIAGQGICVGMSSIRILCGNFGVEGGFGGG